MSLEILTSERISPLIEKGILEIIDIKYCEAFDEHLCQVYPWVKYSDRIDWAIVEKPYKRFRWREANVEESTDFIKTTCLKNFKEVCIVYGADEYGLVVNFDYACEHLENLVIFGWATRFLVGVKRNIYGIVELDHDCFIEIDFADWLTAPN
jgi:hypothetical protein